MTFSIKSVGFAAMAVLLAACEPVSQSSTPAPSSSSQTTASSAQTPPRLSSQTMARNFIEVVERTEPVAERLCRSQAPQLDCDFKIVVDDRANQPANAYQTVDANGQPIIAFTVALIAQARNKDELAFVMGHEAAHHIQGHLIRQRQAATAGAVVFGGLAAITGVSSGSVESAQRLGAAVGARSFSKDFELEADSLGTVITHRAGFDPVRGSQFFGRIPDPGDRFLGTHPPNAARLETVRRVAAGLN